MFDHVVFGVSDYEASKAFFLKALEPLGVVVVSEGPLGVELCRPGSNSSLCIRRIEENRRISTWPSRPRIADKSKIFTARL